MDGKGQPPMTRRIKVIGLGGIGTYLVEPLCRYLSGHKDYSEVTLIDGDRYEEKNRGRQQFDQLNNKAATTVASLKDRFPRVHFKSRGEYVTEDNVVSVVRESDIILLCVDNHATRKVISDRCEELEDVTLISGGNEYTDGNVMYYCRKNGEDVTRPPTKLHPEIADPTDVNPGDEEAVERIGCEAMATSAPQLLFMNLAMASAMLNVYYAQEQGKADFEEVYVDILTQRMRATPEREVVFED